MNRFFQKTSIISVGIFPIGALLPVFFVFVHLLCQAQPTADSLTLPLHAWPGSTTDKIARARQVLLYHFEHENWRMVRVWLDSLTTHFDASDAIATDFDERWLLYFWTDNFTQLFSEVADFQQIKLKSQQARHPPPDDGLFHSIDTYSFRHRHVLYAKLSHRWLAPEEKAFGALLLSHLLREDEYPAVRKRQHQLAASFLKKYPSSRFKKYVQDYLIEKPAHNRHIWGGDILAVYGHSGRELGVTIAPFWGVDLAVTHGFARWNSALRFRIGGHTVRRVIQQGAYFIVPDSTANLFDGSIELGFDVIQSASLRVYPSLGAGWAWLTAPTEPHVGESTRLFFHTGFLSPAFNIDLHMRGRRGLGQIPLRFRVGYRFQNFGKANPDLTGHQMFVSMGIRLSGAFAAARINQI